MDNIGKDNPQNDNAQVSLWKNIFRRYDPWHETVAALWSQTPLFNDISQKEIVRLSHTMHARHYQPEEVVFHANDYGAGAAMILSGKVAIKTHGVTLAELGPGDFFGEVSLVLDERRTADAIALEESELVFFLRIDYEEWITRSPHYGAILSRNLAYTLAERLQHANRVIARHKSD
jgi:CRP/FNR family cyclic AMP-dependent transcriptional regulator